MIRREICPIRAEISTNMGKNYIFLICMISRYCMVSDKISSVFCRDVYLYKKFSVQVGSWYTGGGDGGGGGGKVVL